MKRKHTVIESKGKQCGYGEGSTFGKVVRKVCRNALFKMKRKRSGRGAVVEGLEGTKGPVQGLGKHIQGSISEYHKVGMHAHECAACIIAHSTAFRSEGAWLHALLFFAILNDFLTRALHLNFSLVSQII